MSSKELEEGYGFTFQLTKADLSRKDAQGLQGMP
jgi:hypothetical protein